MPLILAIESSCDKLARGEVGVRAVVLASEISSRIELHYRYRWQIELFFKWFKTILGCRHLLAVSSEGVAIQTYSALIAALMLKLLTGKHPGKRAMELIRFYMMGYAQLDEVIALFAPKKPTA